MGSTSFLVRFLAVVAMLATAGNADKALPLFKAYTKGEAVREGKDYLGRWWQRYLRCTPGENFLEDKHRQGRPKKLDTNGAAICAREFKKKIPVHGKRRHYKSVEEVRTWQLACTGWRDFRLSALQPSRASFPYTPSYTAVTLPAGLPEEHLPQAQGGDVRLFPSLLMETGAGQG
jgi:hypothetical protein